MEEGKFVMTGILMLRELGEKVRPEEVEALFKSERCPKCEKVENAHADFWYVYFETDDQAQRAYQYLREEVRTFRDRPIKARLKSKPAPVSNAGTSTGTANSISGPTPAQTPISDFKRDTTNIVPGPLQNGPGPLSGSAPSLPTPVQKPLSSTSKSGVQTNQLAPGAGTATLAPSFSNVPSESQSYEPQHLMNSQPTLAPTDAHQEVGDSENGRLGASTSSASGTPPQTNSDAATSTFYSAASLSSIITPTTAGLMHPQPFFTSQAVAIQATQFVPPPMLASISAPQLAIPFGLSAQPQISLPASQTHQALPFQNGPIFNLYDMNHLRLAQPLMPSLSFQQSNNLRNNPPLNKPQANGALSQAGLALAAGLPQQQTLAPLPSHLNLPGNVLTQAAPRRLPTVSGAAFASPPVSLPTFSILNQFAAARSIQNLPASISSTTGASLPHQISHLFTPAPPSAGPPLLNQLPPAQNFSMIHASQFLSNQLSMAVSTISANPDLASSMGSLVLGQSHQGPSLQASLNESNKSGQNVQGTAPPFHLTVQGKSQNPGPAQTQVMSGLLPAPFSTQPIVEAGKVVGTQPPRLPPAPTQNAPVKIPAPLPSDAYNASHKSQFNSEVPLQPTQAPGTHLESSPTKRPHPSFQDPNSQQIYAHTSPRNFYSGPVQNRYNNSDQNYHASGKGGQHFAHARSSRPFSNQSRVPFNSFSVSAVSSGTSQGDSRESDNPPQDSLSPDHQSDLKPHEFADRRLEDGRCLIPHTDRKRDTHQSSSDVIVHADSTGPMRSPRGQVSTQPLSPQRANFSATGNQASKRELSLSSSEDQKQGPVILPAPFAARERTISLSQQQFQFSFGTISDSQSNSSLCNVSVGAGSPQQPTTSVPSRQSLASPPPPDPVQSREREPTSCQGSSQAHGTSETLATSMQASNLSAQNLPPPATPVECTPIPPPLEAAEDTLLKSSKRQNGTDSPLRSESSLPRSLLPLHPPAHITLHTNLQQSGASTVPSHNAANSPIQNSEPSGPAKPFSYADAARKGKTPLNSVSNSKPTNLGNNFGSSSTSPPRSSTGASPEQGESYPLPGEQTSISDASGPNTSNFRSAIEARAGKFDSINSSGARSEFGESGQQSMRNDTHTRSLLTGDSHTLISNSSKAVSEYGRTRPQQTFSVSAKSSKPQPRGPQSQEDYSSVPHPRDRDSRSKNYPRNSRQQLRSGFVPETEFESTENASRFQTGQAPPKGPYSERYSQSGDETINSKNYRLFANSSGKYRNSHAYNTSGDQHDANSDLFSSQNSEDFGRGSGFQRNSGRNHIENSGYRTLDRDRDRDSYSDAGALSYATTERENGPGPCSSNRSNL